ncbi:sugar phosphate isomerase/epimerase [Polycladomyces sp. WAk]|uniref:Sugar phosphate isomerase/epimerase n=1 Tax=Polycladomyces zharkentensis TaxID=2807616 RepID=A0ABS2WGK1_9BACL|nr:sugar phosphate isomerase/epimerase [Polycladomyces sp. WAk]
MKISVFTVLFKDRSIHQTFRICADLGVDGVELYGREPHLSEETSALRVEEIKALSKEYGLPVIGIGTYIGRFSTDNDADCQRDVERLERFLEHAAELECPLIRVGCGGPHAFRAHEYHFLKGAEWIRKCADRAAMYGCKLMIEIHNGSLVETVNDALRFLRLVDRDNVGLIHDAGNMAITDTDFGKASIHQLKDHLFHVHVKDVARVPSSDVAGGFQNLTRHGMEHFQQRLLGEGDVDHRPVVEGLMEIGYTGYLSIESHAPLPDVERAKADIKALREIIDQVSAKRANAR